MQFSYTLEHLHVHLAKDLILKIKKLDFCTLCLACRRLTAPVPISLTHSVSLADQHVALVAAVHGPSSELVVWNDFVLAVVDRAESDPARLR